MQTLNEKYGLDKKTELEIIGPGKVGIVKCVKRRLLVADAERFVETAARIRAVDPDTQVYLICTDNICSKSVGLLQKNGIDILIAED